MKQIKKIIDFDGTQRYLFDLTFENKYLKLVLGYKDPFKCLTEVNIINAIPITHKITNLSIEQNVAIRLIRNNKKDIVLATPQKMQDYINKLNAKPKYKNLFYNNNKATPFSKAILKVMNYKGFRTAKTKGIWLAKCLNIKTCPYCNSQYTIVVEDGDSHKARFQFDHFFPKSRYPFLCLSLYNLIPSCASCNLTKKETDFNIVDFVHPYVGSLSDEFNFKLSKASENKYLIEKTKIEITDIEIEICNKSQKALNHNKVFNLKNIHERHKDIIQELLNKLKHYPDSKKQELLLLKDMNGAKLFSDESEITRLLYGHYVSEDEINQRPLTKLMQDIVKSVETLKA